MKHTSKLLTALLLTMAFLVSALPVHGIHASRKLPPFKRRLSWCSLLILPVQ